MEGIVTVVKPKYEAFLYVVPCCRYLYGGSSGRFCGNSDVSTLTYPLFCISLSVPYW